MISGLGEVDGTKVYVTNGAGFWGPPVRVGAPPDITLVELTRRVRLPGVPRDQLDSRSAYPLQSTRGHAAEISSCPTSPTGRAARASRLLGTGDFTHPAWFAHLQENLVAAEPGLFVLDSAIEHRLPVVAAEAADPVHAQRRDLDDLQAGRPHAQGPPSDLHAGLRVRGDGSGSRCSRPGCNLSAATAARSSGWTRATCSRSRSRRSPDAYLVPAHIWTPWFSALGSKSGFDAIADCYADLAEHITAVETGLSSDPEMNQRVSSLDAYQLVSNSDAHSPQALAREATALRPASWTTSRVRAALRTGNGLAGTIEFFPEEGKYHGDGHRDCRVNWTPAQTREANGVCPVCGRQLTVGVLARVEDLADRRQDTGRQGPSRSPTSSSCTRSLGEIEGVGPKSKTVEGKVNSLVAALGPELEILDRSPGERGRRRRRRASGRRRAPVARREGDPRSGLRRRVRGDPALRARASCASAGTTLCSTSRSWRQPRRRSARRGSQGDRAPQAHQRCRRCRPPPRRTSRSSRCSPGMEEVGTGLLDRLDAMQRVAASAPGGPLLIVAGPGTGKTRTLTHRLAYLCAEMNVYPEQCLAITFTRRAAEELRHRLGGLLGPGRQGRHRGSTFHALALGA